MSRPEVVVDFLVVQVPGGERGQQVGGTVGGLDQRDVSRRQRGRSVLGELLLGRDVAPVEPDVAALRAEVPDRLLPAGLPGSRESASAGSARRGVRGICQYASSGGFEPVTNPGRKTA